MIYLVEDDDNIRELVEYTLNAAGMPCRAFSESQSFWAAARSDIPELILLDIMLPGEDGITILKKLKSAQHTASVPVIMLTAKSSEIDCVKGLENGADDYITKPFGVMELTARVRARLRPVPPEETQDKKNEFHIGCLYVNESSRLVRVSGESVTLTLKEFELLCYLLENRQLVLSRDRLYSRIWGYSFDGESRTVDVHIRTLRQKLGKAGDLIETVRGIGYRVNAESKGENNDETT